MKKMKVFSYLALGLGVAQILLMLTSWLLTAAMPEDYNRSLLSSEGIRWFFGQFQDHLASPVLVWLVLGGIAYGAFCRSGIVHYKPDEYRQRFAMGVASFELGGICDYHAGTHPVASCHPAECDGRSLSKQFYAEHHTLYSFCRNRSMLQFRCYQ